MNPIVARRTTLAALTAATGTLALAACGRSSEEDTGTSGGSAKSTTVDDTAATGTIEFWAGGADGESLPDFLAAFKTANPDVTVNVTQIPEDDFDTKLTTAIAAGTVPDMVYLYSQTQSTMLATGAFAAVPDGLVDASSFFASAQEAALLDGKAHAVPWYVYAQVLYYRKDLAAAAGVAAPTTWDEMKTFSKAVQAKGSQFGTGLSVGWDGYTAQNLNEFVHENGGSFLSDDGSEWTIDSAECVGAAEYFGSLITDGYASADGPQFLDTTPWFTTGEIASIVNGPWLPGWLDDANGDGWAAEHIGAVPPPAGSAGSKANLGGGSLAVLADAANPTGAWKLVRWLSQSENQLSWYSTFGNLPSVQAAWDDPAIAGDELLTPVRDAMSSAIAVPAVSTWSQVSTIIGEQMERVARGQATAQEALQEAQSQAEDIGTGA